MRKFLTVLVIFAITLVIYTTLKFKGTLPAVLSPKTPPPTASIPSSLGLSVPEGFSIAIFAQGLGAARDLELTADGTLLLSIPAQGKVVALPDKNADGKADEVREVLVGLNRPHGLAFYKNRLFLAEETKVSRYNWDSEKLTASFEEKLFDLPAGGRHFTRTLTFDREGRLFVSIGSTCDVCLEKHPWFGAVIISDAQGVNPRLFARGLRNSVFIATNPQSGELWGTEMGRDNLGDDLPPDEINIIRQDKDYGWPQCYGNRVPDTDFVPNPSCGETEPPVFEIAAHSAPLGLAFDRQGNLLVAYHGSWNRSTPAGYKVVRLKLKGDRVVSEEDFLTGFLPTNARDNSGVIGRPVDVIFDKQGNLYISDDKAGVVYRIWR